MSREGPMLAARERARRAAAALDGAGTPVLMGYALVVLAQPPCSVVAASPATPANAPLHGATSIAESSTRLDPELADVTTSLQAAE